MTRGDIFKHIRKNGTLPAALLKNSLVHLLITSTPIKKVKVKYDGPTSSWPCVVAGCELPRYVEAYGKVRQRCIIHQRQYNNERCKVARVNRKRKNALSK